LTLRPTDEFGHGHDRYGRVLASVDIEGDDLGHRLVADGLAWHYTRYSKDVACLGNPDPGDMKAYCPVGKETFDDGETTEEAPS